jgi:peptidoglycan/LPS O-acetylase OafA/YrhL
MTRLRTVLTLSFTVGALIPVITQRFEFPNLWASVVCALVVGALGGWLVPGRVGESAIAVALGSIIGLTLDAAVDWFYYGQDRNLFGLEWIIWAFVVGVPLAFGNWGAGTLRTYRKRRPNDSAV